MPTAQVQFLIRELRSQKPCRTAKEEKNLGNTLGFPKIYPKTKLVIVQSLSCVRLFRTPWTATCQASLSFTISWNLLRFMLIELVTPSNKVILCCPFSSCPQSFWAVESFLLSWLFTSCGLSIGALASASVLPMNIHGWSPFGLTGLISLQSTRLSRVFSNTTVWRHQFFGSQPSLWSNSPIHTWLLEKP